MSSLFASSVVRPVRLRRRPDLDARRQAYQGREYWVIKDPLALKYFRFEDEEYALLEMLDGQHSLEEIQRHFEKQFAPQKISVGELQQFIGMLHRSALVVSDLPGQDRQLFQRHRERKQRERREMLSNLLSLRFRGFDPDRLLTTLDRRLGWLFSPWAAISCLMLGLAALLLIAAQFELFRAKLPGFQDFFAAKNWLWLGATLAVTKILHEFGHGLSCKRFGGECHEMGVMLLVMTPCLYCNVSDSWMLPNKWRRAYIGAAGMYVELWLASMATFVWWFTEPGMVNYLALNVMFICSVSTLVFNANPLMRYDGYYILSDLLEIPNLRTKASAIVQRKVAEWLLGMRPTPDPFLPRRRQWWFAAYAVAAAVYRWVVAISILFFLYRVFEPYGLKIIGQVLALASLYGLAVQPVWRLGKFLCEPGRIDQVKKTRLAFSVMAISAVMGGGLFLPLPFYVQARLYVQPQEAAAVYVDVAGTVQEVLAAPGDQVEAGQPLVKLESLDLQLALVRLEGERNQRDARRRSLLQRSLAGDEAASLEIAPLNESLIALDDQLAQRREDLKRLTIVAPKSGVVFNPASLPTASRENGVLPTWSGWPLEDRQRGAHFQSGVLLGRIGEPDALEAVLAITQDDIDFIKPGQSVKLTLEPFPGQTFTTHIQHIAADDMKSAPLSLSEKGGGELLTRTDSTGKERPVQPTYQANAPFTDPTGRVAAGITGTARIRAGNQSLAARLWRTTCRTFRFEL